MIGCGIILAIYSIIVAIISYNTGENFFQIFFHVLQTAFDGLTDGTFVHTFRLGNFPIALAENDTGIHTAALDLRQGVEGVPESAETLHALQQLLRRRLGQARRVFDPIITVEGILHLVTDDPALVSQLVELSARSSAATSSETSIYSSVVYQE